MLPLRFPKLWSAFGWLLVAGVVVGSLMPGTAMPEVSINDKVQHAAAYGLLMVWFGGLYRREFYPLIGAMLLALGLVLDVLQSFTDTRFLDWYDVGADLVGIAVGFAICVWFMGGWCQRLEQRLLS